MTDRTMTWWAPIGWALFGLIEWLVDWIGWALVGRSR